MEKIKVLVVDDSCVVSRIVASVLTADASIEVVGTAVNGQAGVESVERLNPDVVTMDVEMPVMDGLEALAEIRKLHPRLPVIMFSTLTERGASITLDALAAGASDYVTKPSNVGSISECQERLREQLVPKIKTLHSKSLFWKSVVPVARPKVRPAVSSMAPVEIVAIGVSTGGPNALTEVLGAFPKDFPVPIVIVQHMPPTFTRLLAERLNDQCQISVVEAVQDQPLSPGYAYFAPGDFHMTVSKVGVGPRLQLNQQEKENSCRPAVDVLFRSVADNYGAGMLGVILTGMGQDGLLGCEHARRCGGRVLAQDESTSVVWGMPGAVVRAGLADDVRPLTEISSEILKRVQQWPADRLSHLRDTAVTGIAR